MIKKSLSILAIDPGVEFGWAFFPSGNNMPSQCGVVTSSNRGPNSNGQLLKFLAKTRKTRFQARKVIGKLKPDIIVCEWPAFFESQGGQTVATSGSLVKLTFAVGLFASVAWQAGINFIPVEVINWKGQLKKLVVQERIERRLGAHLVRKLKPDSHSWDAIGIGLYCRGEF